MIRLFLLVGGYLVDSDLDTLMKLAPALLMLMSLLLPRGGISRLEVVVAAPIEFVGDD